LSIVSSDLLAPHPPPRHIHTVNASGQEEEMRDDFLTQSWANSHHSFARAVSGAIAGVVDAATVGFARLHREQYDAPWRHRSQRCG